jgi:hypothetical protein
MSFRIPVEVCKYNLFQKMKGVFVPLLILSHRSIVSLLPLSTDARKVQVDALRNIEVQLQVTAPIFVASWVEESVGT